MIAMLAQPADHVLGDHPPDVAVRVQEDDGEDGAAVARDVIVAAQARTQPRRDLAQHEVARPAVQPLVHPAEVVGPDEDEDGARLALLGLGQRRLQLGLELRPLGQAGHLVEEGAGDGARVGGEGGGEAQEVLPPGLVAEGVGGGREIKKTVLPPGRLIPVEAQPRPRRQLRARAPVPLAAFRAAGRVVLGLGEDPAQRDPVEHPVGAAAGETDRPLVVVPVLVDEALVQLGRRRRVHQLRDRLQPPFVEQDLTLAAGPRGDVERHRGRPAEALDEANIGPEDVGCFAHAATAAALRP